MNPIIITSLTYPAHIPRLHLFFFFFFFFFFFLCFPSRLPLLSYLRMSLLFVFLMLCCLLLWARGRPTDQTDRPPSRLSLRTQTPRRRSVSPARAIHPSDPANQP